jgi:hypothetical protein
MKLARLQFAFFRLTVVFTCVFLHTTSEVQNAEAQYLIKNSTITNGCGTQANTQYRLTATVGQPIIGTMTGGGSPSYGSIIGFWYARQSFTTVGVANGKELPTEFRLDQNYPNPFNPTTVVSCQWPVVSHVRIAVYDILGREVAVLIDDLKEAGRYQVMWNAKDCASGVYVCRMNAGAYTMSRKMILAK